MNCFRRMILRQSSSLHCLHLVAITALLLCSYYSHSSVVSAFQNIIKTPLQHSANIISLRKLAPAAKATSSPRVVYNKMSSNASSNGTSKAVASPTISLSSYLKPLLIFGIGYGLGGASAPGWQRHTKLTTKIGLTNIILSILITREVWRFVPPWIKPRVKRFGKSLVKGVVAPLLLLRGRSKCDDSESEGWDDCDAQDDDDSKDDITDLSNFITKVQRLMNAAKSKLDSLDEQQQQHEEKENVYIRNASFLALLQMLNQIKSRRANSRDELYRAAGSQEIPDEIFQDIDIMFELADLAYNEHPSGGDIKSVLKGMGYDLIKHDTTTPVPGYLGHYIALSNDHHGNNSKKNESGLEEEGEEENLSTPVSSSSKKEKIAVIGIKGTSNLEDFLTDMCANSEEYTLDHPFYEGGSKTLRCHEGVYISSQRLVKDLFPLIQNLLLPSGYKIVVVGHSLGAGCATIVSLLLRATIPSLRDDPKKLKVWAFASPPVLDLKSALGCSSFVTTVVNNSDVIPRCNIGPLVVMARLLRAVNKRLTERNLGVTDLLFKDWMKKSPSDNLMNEDGDEMLMSFEEIVSAIADAIACDDDHDKDYLYVPGRVLVLYDLWEKEQQRMLLENSQKGDSKDYATIMKEWVQYLKEVDDPTSIDDADTKKKNIPVAEEVILTDGACNALRLIELDGRLLDDHLAPAYRSSIANILSSRGMKSIST